MQIVARQHLLGFLTGSSMDPMQEFREEMTAISQAILDDLPAGVQYLVYSDHENGEDPQVSWEGFGRVSRDLINEQYRSDGDSYYGVSVTQLERVYPADDRRVYNCYLGGSPLNSAPGFVISTAALAD
jgi:hypothetical protein